MRVSMPIARRVMDRYDEWREGAIDRRYGIDTRGPETPATSVAVLAGRGHHYEPIQIPVFRRIVRALPVAPGALTFVDFGSGKGRALVLAAEYGFRRIIGIEFAPSLHAAALRNRDRVHAMIGDAPPIELHCGDALEYELPAEDCLCFLYNTFDEAGMAAMAARIDSSMRKRPRRLFVAYRNPRFGEALSRAGFLRCLERNRSFELYSGGEA